MDDQIFLRGRPSRHDIDMGPCLILKYLYVSVIRLQKICEGTVFLESDAQKHTNLYRLKRMNL